MTADLHPWGYAEVLPEGVLTSRIHTYRAPTHRPDSNPTDWS